MLDTSQWPMLWLGLGLVAAAAVIAVAGARVTKVADQLADVTRLGEAVFGAVLLGATTSLPGIVTSTSTAWYGFAELSVSNAIGGIAAQTAFLSIADLFYRRANLEHAAASPENLFQTGLLVLMLVVPLVAESLPSVTLFAIHPASIVLPAVYLLGIHTVRDVRGLPSWRAEPTAETVRDEGGDTSTYAEPSTLWIRFGLLALVIAGAGYFVAGLGIGLVEQAGFSESVVGVLLTAVATSLPELVTCVAAVRRGAVNLAVGGIIGGNAFDVLFLSFADVAYRDGSLYHAITERQTFFIGVNIILACTLLLGMLRRERKGIASIGLESTLVLVVYVASVVLITQL